jgi:2,3-dihydro-2,3-dihydroxybenzoate dehydrogenase
LRVSAHQVDITSSRAVDELVDELEQTLGPIEFLVNVAGVLRPAPAVAITDDDWAATFAVNATGVLHACRAVVPRMMQRHAGAIVTVASNASAVPRVGMGAYVASKAAATAFTKNLALEVARYGVRCNVVAPGSTDTPMLRTLWFGANGELRSAILEEHAKFNAVDGRMDQFRVGIPLGKLAQPVDVAEAVLFLLSDRASHITMQDLQVDGGAALGA